MGVVAEHLNGLAAVETLTSILVNDHEIVCNPYLC